VLQLEMLLLTVHKTDDGCADYTIKSKLSQSGKGMLIL
jgi:hypothetical protein